MRLRAVSLAAGIGLLALAPLPLRADDAGSVTATVVASAVNIEVDVPAHSVLAGSPFVVRAKVAYVGGASAVAVVKLHLAPTDLFVRDGTEITVTLKPEHSLQAHWQVCGPQAGTYILMASVEVEGWQAESGAVVVEISGKQRARCPGSWTAGGGPVRDGANWLRAGGRWGLIWPDDVLSSTSLWRAFENFGIACSRCLEGNRPSAAPGWSRATLSRGPSTTAMRL